MCTDNNTNEEIDINYIKSIIPKDIDPLEGLYILFEYKQIIKLYGSMQNYLDNKRMLK